MAQTTRAEAERYRSHLTRVRDAAVSYTRSRVMGECAVPDVAQARESAKEIVADAVDVFGTQAQALACDMFDEIADDNGWDFRARTFDGVTDPVDVDKNVRYFARLLPDDLADFVDMCAERAGFYVWREANMCVAMNVGVANGEG